MPVVAANDDPVKIAGPGDAKQKYEYRLDGNGLLLARSKQAATDTANPRRRLVKGDRGAIEREKGEEIWAFNDDRQGNGEDAVLELQQAGFYVGYGSRPTIANIEEVDANIKTDTWPEADGFDFDGSNYPYTVDPTPTIQSLQLTRTGDVVAHITLDNGTELDLPLAGTIGVIDDKEIDAVEFRDPNGTNARVSGGWSGE